MIKKKNNLVSIIVNCLDIPHFIEKCLESLSKQTFTDLEIICAYSELSEKSVNVINKFCAADKRFKIIKKQKKNSNELLNYALKSIYGKYFLICDTDDYYPENTIERMFGMIENSGAPMCICNTNLSFESNSDKRIYDVDNAYIYPIPMIGNTVTLAPDERNFMQMQKHFRATLFRTDFIFINNLKIPSEPIDDGIAFVGIAMMNAKNISFVSENLVYKIIRPETGFRSNQEYTEKLIISKFAMRKFAKSRRSMKKWIEVIERSVTNLNVGNFYRKFIAYDYLDQVSVHLVDHCNLNCKSCSHFSCLANKDDFCLDAKDFDRDMKRLAKITKKKIKTLELYGGEPLLHPNVPLIMKIARKHFPKSLIRLITNGVLLEKQEPEFWKAVKKYKITLSITRYPIAVDWTKVRNIAKSYGVDPVFFGGTAHVEKTLYHKPFDFTGSQDPATSFIHCTHSNSCINLYKGKLFPCPIIAYIHYFNRQFKKDLRPSVADSIDIYEDWNLREISAFFARPVPFCRNCNTKDATFGHKWETTKKDISEYTIVKKGSDNE